MQIDPTATGERLKRARLLAGVNTRREFEDKYNISANTLQGWEQGKNPLSIKGAKRIASALKSEGLICSVDWLMYGQGMPPRSYDALYIGTHDHVRKNTNLAYENIYEEEIIFREIQLFKQQDANTIVFSVIDDAMIPYFNLGDYIGGIRLFNEALKPFFNNFCIVELENHLIAVRCLQPGFEKDTYTLSCTNHKSTATPLNIFNTKIICAAPIVWHRRKLVTMRNGYN
jgi:transcriptional regulator with XRE-family HTH domain